ncbi:MAG TPA: di-trans,poly-cis-decaprenylcistransferase [Planctomycetaceae bacterium]|nr:di-trans,poly-cis-decaprenylcistransferase [Planctomycetaceae bacterium]
MDGNGRWARAQGKPRIEGHMRGVESVRKVMDACREFGIEVLTLYCLSSENWKRPPEELEFLMELLKQYLIGEREKLVENNLKLRIIGRRERLPKDVQDEMDRTLEACRSNTGMTLCLAINYGARQELCDGVRSLCERARQDPQFELDSIDESTIDDSLYTAGLPDPDLLIRSSGEMRISNFLLWQISYAEIYVTDTLWPEFGRDALADAIQDYSRRQRRFGGIEEPSR